MQDINCQLHAIVMQFDGAIEAQLLEVDIAARGKNREALLAELSHAITLSYEIALELGETPFANILPHPLCFERDRAIQSGTEFGVIQLPDDVGAALAIALHQRRPLREIKVYAKAA